MCKSRNSATLLFLLSSAGTLLPRVRTLPMAPWPNGGLESLRAPCFVIAILKSETFIRSTGNEPSGTEVLDYIHKLSPLSRSTGSHVCKQQETIIVISSSGICWSGPARCGETVECHSQCWNFCRLLLEPGGKGDHSSSSGFYSDIRQAGK
ncbi:hypothetical protein PoB_002382700 [Plakobranchus ocellatus]|uniref:Secreted protein n=1 Tax=Plakobranchus ocellatus TaxID=259542 RepID=A0AAV3ZQ56_9GAST|nr:hypothetical protein PoB_002382700 [Plakobranchus ocellatus]